MCAAHARLAQLCCRYHLAIDKLHLISSHFSIWPHCIDFTLSSRTCAQVGVLCPLVLVLVLVALGAQPLLVVEADVRCSQSHYMTKVVQVLEC